MLPQRRAGARAWDHPRLGRRDRAPGPQVGTDTPDPLPPAPGLGFPCRVQVPPPPPRCVPLRRCPPGGSPLSSWGFAFVGWRRAALCSPEVVEQRQEPAGLCRAPALPPSPLGGVPRFQQRYPGVSPRPSKTLPAVVWLGVNLWESKARRCFGEANRTEEGRNRRQGATVGLGRPCWGGGPGQGAPGSMRQLSSGGSEETRHPPLICPHLPLFTAVLVMCPVLLLLLLLFF